MTAYAGWAALEDLALCLMALGETGWRTLVARCPLLTHLAIRTSGHMTDGMLAIVGAAWPRMRSFRVYSRSHDVDLAQYKISVAGLRHLSAWRELEVCWLDPNPPAPLPPTIKPDTGDLSVALAAWPNLRELVAPTIVVSCPPSVFAGRVAPRLERLHLGRRPLDLPAVMWSADDWRTFLQEHPHLHYLPMAGFAAVNHDAYAIDVSRFARELRGCSWRGATCILYHVEALFERLHRLEQLTCRPDVVARLAIRNALLGSTQEFRAHAQQPPPADWVPSSLTALPVRAFHMIQLTVQQSMHLSDGDLRAIALTCPRLALLELSLDASIKDVSSSRTDVQPATLLFVLDRCPELSTLHLDTAPLAGVRRLTTDLSLLPQLTRRTKCTVRFRVFAFDDSSVESTAWFRRHAVCTDLSSATPFPRIHSIAITTL